MLQIVKKCCIIILSTGKYSGSWVETFCIFYGKTKRKRHCDFCFTVPFSFLRRLYKSLPFLLFEITSNAHVVFLPRCQISDAQNCKVSSCLEHGHFGDSGIRVNRRINRRVGSVRIINFGFVWIIHRLCYLVKYVMWINNILPFGNCCVLSAISPVLLSITMFTISVAPLDEFLKKAGYV